MTETTYQLSENDIAKNKQATIFEQPQVAYTTLSATPGKACANCVFFRDTGYDGIDYQHCHLVAAWPDPILPTGYCNRWEAKPEPPATVAEEVAEAVTDAVVAAVETLAENVAVVQAEGPKKTLWQQAKDALFPPRDSDSFSVFKGSDGKWYWIAKYTNAYEDKEGEIFTEKAHEEYIRRVDMGLVDKPELWTWHTKGTKHGQADVVFGVGRIVVAVGHFDETPEAKQAIHFYQKNAGKIKLSHGALAPKWALQNGLIHAYNTFEISTLPKGVESNPYTSYEAVKAMQPDPKKLEWVATVLGKEKAEAIVKETAEFSKSLDEMQVRYKDFAAVGDSPASPTSEAQKSMGETFIEMVKEQGAFVQLLQKMEQRQNSTDELVKSLKAQNETYEKEVKELRDLVNAGPRRPSDSSSTGLSQDATEAVKKELAANGIDKDESAFWGAPVKGVG